MRWIDVDLNIQDEGRNIFDLEGSKNESTFNGNILSSKKNKMNTKNSCSCCPPDSNQAFNDNIYSKARVPNKTKIKTASRILKKLSFKVLGTVSEEQAIIDVGNRDQKVEYIPVSTVNSGWLEDHNNVMKLRNSSSKLYLVLA